MPGGDVTARLASLAQPGEILISETAYTSSGLELGELERQQLALKGKSEPVDVRLLRLTPG